MIYFILLSLFSLFVGVNNVNASDDCSLDGDNLYVTYESNNLTFTGLKYWLENYLNYEWSFNNTDDKYNFSTYNSFLVTGVYWSYYENDAKKNIQFVDAVQFGDSMTLNKFDGSVYVEGNSPHSFSPGSFQFYDSISLNSYYDSMRINPYFFPLYTKNVSSNYNVFLKVKSAYCSNYGEFCTHASAIDGDYTVVQVGWKGGELKGFYDFATEEVIKNVDYTVKIYVDDVLKDSYSDSGIVGKTITLKGLDDDKLKASESNKYEVVLVDGTNEFELRYYTSTYGTVYQQINTDNSELYLPFSYDKLKTMFPSVNFELWTSYEQFNFVLMFNVFFILFMIFIGYIILKMFYFIKGWFL